MWTRKFSKIYQDITKEAIWSAWSDVNNWPQWDKELAYCAFKDSFVEGAKFILKPLKGPRVKIILSDVVPYQTFTDHCQFLGASMYDSHELEELPVGLRITNTIRVTGPLAFLWTRLVASHVANAVPIQTDNLVDYARTKYD